MNYRIRNPTNSSLVLYRAPGYRLIPTAHRETFITTKAATNLLEPPQIPGPQQQKILHRTH
jgi:hypothetical protein